MPSGIGRAALAHCDRTTRCSLGTRGRAGFRAADAGTSAAQGLPRPPVPLEKIIADVNLDMISRSVTRELNIVGAHTYPVMQAFVDTVAALGLVRVRQGHEGARDDTLSDLTDRSDQGSFKHKKIPFVMFNNEEHADYHRPTDEALRINPEFFYRSAQTAAAFLRVLDGSLD